MFNLIDSIGGILLIKARNLTNDMIIYVLLSFLTQGLIATEVSNTISREVRNGSIASNLIKPISYEKRMLFEGFGSMLYGFVLVFIIGFSAVVIISIKTGSGIKHW